MYSSTIGKVLIPALSLFIYNTQAFATVANASPSAPSIRSLLPSNASGNEISQPFAKELSKLANIKQNPSLNQLVFGGGYGGNQNTGTLFYDGLATHLSPFPIMRDDYYQSCTLKNQYGSVYQYRYWFFLRLVSYDCVAKSPDHNDVYWDANMKNEVNGSYSPANDTLYALTKISEMYQMWFGIPASVDRDGSPVPIQTIIHSSTADDAILYDDRQILLGDGNSEYYPFTSPGIISFMVGHLFTAQHSKLQFDGEPGAISVAFSAMADQAIKYYLNGQNNWENW